MYYFENSHRKIFSKPWAWGLAALVTGSLAWSAQAAPGPVELQTSPPGAKVYLNGVYSGMTPCQVPLKGRHGELRLELEGYLPAWAFVRPRPGSSGQYYVALRPGVASPGSRPEDVAGFYPPGRGRPPATFFYRKSHELAGYRYAMPPQWSEVSRGPSQVTMARGACRATLSCSSSTLAERLQVLRGLREEQGWKVVLCEETSHQAMLRLERQARGVLGVDRAAVLLEVKQIRGESQLLELNFDSPDCAGTFDFTRDLDYLRGSLGLPW